MLAPKLRIPAYRHYKPKNLAVVRIDGRDIYLGRYGSPESHERYNREVAQWLAGESKAKLPPAEAVSAVPTINELALRYCQFAESYYVKNGKPTTEVKCINEMLRRLLRVYGESPSTEFGPKALKLVRDQFVADGLCRNVINRHIGRLKRMFKWAVEYELIPVTTYQALATVAGLRRGRTMVRESVPIRPADDADVEKSIPFMPAQVQAMVRLQRLTGCRPGEICMLRPCDVDMREDVWCYTPAEHKTQHHGHERRIYLGPKAQEILRPWLVRDPASYCFSPAEARAAFDAARKAARKTPMTPSQAKRKPKRKPKKQPGQHYTVFSYRRAIDRACKAAGVTSWGPNRLRHSCATELRKLSGLEASQVVLGHKSADITQVYAERNFELARRLMQEMG